MIKNLDFCELNFCDNYVICKVNPGATVTTEKSQLQTETILDYYKEKPFVYITHRENSYAVDPKIYSKSSKIKTLVGFAVVSSNYSSVRNAHFEKMFFDKPFEVFTTLDNAISWANELLKK
ncbi:hypothetical protein [Winogradskyella sp.]|uniref:hypothetical protein n=1 Tax=Winogradskyella sp. TaxID=1883156 RepID=UPI0025F31356|nr:hypothetical protein [Winogradskyella sp.]